MKKDVLSPSTVDDEVPLPRPKSQMMAQHQYQTLQSCLLLDQAPSRPVRVRREEGRREEGREEGREEYHRQYIGFKAVSGNVRRLLRRFSPPVAAPVAALSGLRPREKLARSPIAFLSDATSIERGFAYSQIHYCFVLSKKNWKQGRTLAHPQCSTQLRRCSVPILLTTET